MRLALLHEVTVITRSNNRGVIETALESIKNDHVPRFIYVDLPDLFVKLKKKGILPVPVYYLLWQVIARCALRVRLKDFDIVHHVTFNGFRFPGAWWKTGIPVVLGPLGGGSITASAYRRCFKKRWLSEWLRGLSVSLWLFNPWTLVSLLSSDAVLAVGREMVARFSTIGIKADLMLETAVPRGLEQDMGIRPGASKKDFLLVGNLEPWKAWQIAFEAFAMAICNGLTGQKLIVIGQGSQLTEARNMAVRLGVVEHIEFVEYLPRKDVWEKMRTARALIFSSVRDTSGNVVLEAMALRCPVICFRHQGVGWMTDNTCAIRIEPGKWNHSVNGFAEAITRLTNDNSLVDTLGNAGRTRAMEKFSWNAKIKQMETVYHRVIQQEKSF